MAALCRRAVAEHPPLGATQLLRRRCCMGVTDVGPRRGYQHPADGSFSSGSAFHLGGADTARVGSTRSHNSYSSPGSFGEADYRHHNRRDYRHRGYTVVIGGPIGSGKTELIRQLCRNLPLSECRLGVRTNDLLTLEVAEFLARREALPASPIRGVETNACPHPANLEDVRRKRNAAGLEKLTLHHRRNK